MLGVLDGCLLNGWGLKSVDSIVVAANVATVTINAGHSFELGSTALIAGATPSGLNGDKVLTFVSTTQIKFSAPGISDQTATGSITAKVSPLGWAKPFSGTNLAVYTSTDPGSFGGMLRLDDTGTTNARGYAYESMTDLNTGVNQFPSTAQMASPGLFFPKSNAASGAAKNWMLFGDERAFYLWVEPNSVNVGSGSAWFFGDLIAQGSGDVYAMALTGFSSDYTASGAGNSSDLCYAQPVGSVDCYLPRQPSKQVSPVKAAKIGSALWYSASPVPSGSTNYSNSFLNFPNGSDNGVFICTVNVAHDNLIRGQFPGFYHLPQNLVGSGGLPNRYRFTSLEALPSRAGVVMAHAAPASAILGYTLFDVTGPWR
jgi:hypothetical protein